MSTMITNMSNMANINIFRLARLVAGIERRDVAARRACISETTLGRIERGAKIPDPGEVSSMAQVYASEALMNEYCKEICPIGRKLAQAEKGQKNKAVFQAAQ